MPADRDGPSQTPVPGLRMGSVRLERRVALGIAAMVPSFGLIGVFAMLSVDGPGGTVSTMLCALALVSTVPVGAWWFLRSADASHMPGWFVVYADVGVASMLFTFVGRDLALNAAALFAVIGIYIVYFTRRRVLGFHVLFVNAVVLMLAALALAENAHDVASTVTRTFVTLLVVNSVLVFRAVIQRQLDLANTDSLTGLLNRRGLELKLERMMASLHAERSVAVIVVDLDQFKLVNDTYGHAVGDRVLRRTARRLDAATGTRPCVARTGGEEFTIALSVTGAAVHRIADEIRESIHDPVDEVPVTVSVGVALIDGSRWPAVAESGGGPDLLHKVLLDADTAMYESKHAGGNRTTVYADE
ncbi:MAG: diguanylate cyclase domain-containing protein [Rhodococcus sp. (in: high G+C Gram-positive bacteria)]